MPSIFKPLSYENRLVGLLALSFGLVFFDRLALSFLFPFLQEELSLTNRHLGMLSSALALAWAISGALVGAWSDRHGRRKSILIAAVLLLSLCSALSGIVTGFLSLLIFRAMMGLAEGPVLPIAQSMLVAHSNPQRRGLNMGLVQGSSAGLFGAVICPPVVIALAESLGWRAAFISSLLPGLLIAGLIWRYVQPDGRPQAGSAEPSPAQRPSRLTLLRERNIWLCTLICCFYLTWFIVLVSFTPTFLVNSRGFSPATMGLLISCLGVAWVLWGFVVPALSDRIGRRPSLVIFSLLAASCPIALLYAPSAPMLGGLLVLTYTGLGGMTLLMSTIPAETVSRHSIATALGMIMGIGELVGGFAAPTLSGFAADSWGLPIVMWIASLAALISAGLALLLRETAPRVLARRAQALRLAGGQP